MGPQLYAHSRGAQSQVRHLLEDHLRGSAALARRFGEVFGAGELAEYLALVHDVGKGCAVWQQRLVGYAEPYGKPVGIPHKGAGADLVSRYIARPFAAAVEGHHGGLPDPQALAAALAKVSGGGRDATQAREAVEAVAKVVPQILRDQRIALPLWLSGLGADRLRLGVDLLVRMLFSCLVDADFLDTEAHFTAAPVRVAAPVDLAGLVDRFEERRSAFLRDRKASPVADLRERVYQEAVASAAGEPGMYILHVPTGGAKTLAAAGFSLNHAVRHGMKRVVVAVPFTSITEQNAAVYRDLLDPPKGSGEVPVVLEHHSSVRLAEKDDDHEEDGVDEVEQWARLASENWDAPFVVTTTVQLFESLFARKPSALRKVHRLARSVIVLDEVQALPDQLLAPILSGLRGLVEHFGVSVVLASATQPEFWSLQGLQGMPRRQIVSDTTALFEELRRVRYDWRLGEDVTWVSIADEIAAQGGPQVLSIVNTTKDSALLHRLLEDRVGGGVFHLSTRMTSGHRREVIAAIRADLKDRRPVRVVSTSLIEAGVDVDFPRVYRAWAPAESQQQAAGRCNRERLMDSLGTVVVFRPSDGGQPKDTLYKAALDATGLFFGPDGLAEPDDLAALRSYYAKRYAYLGNGGRLMGEEVEAARRELDFPKVDQLFRMIDNQYARPVLVIREEAERAAIEADVDLLCDPRRRMTDLRGVFRRLQPHIASLPKHEVVAAEKSGLAEPVIGDLTLWLGTYHPERGLDPAEKEDRSAYQI